MKVMISGATSMIGAALTKQFIENGHEVYAIVRQNSGKEHWLPDSPNLHFVYSDLDKYAFLPPVKEQIDVFYHFAWAGTDKKSRQSLSVQIQNVKYTEDAMEYALRCGCRKFIGAGSQAEYGKQLNVISENTRPEPDTPYGIAKLAAGLYCLSKAKSAGIECIWGRIFSIYGPHDNKDTMISASVDKSLRGEQLKLSSCEQNWNYLYETDAAEIFYRLGIKDVESGVYNIADDKSRQLKEYVELMVKALRRDGVNAPDPFFDVNIQPTAHLNANVKKLYKAIDYEPKVSFIRGIHEIIAERKKNV